MATVSEAVRYLRSRRLLSQITHSQASMRYELEISKKNGSAPISLPQWMFEEE
ncbi:MAG: hypothetical protein HYT71_02095 [Candidatus Aenigmarchaeota archaeon]|nr:hypothetical protein [Candidatus Aenigmarchaeota archaeon]